MNESSCYSGKLFYLILQLLTKVMGFIEWCGANHDDVDLHEEILILLVNLGGVMKELHYRSALSKVYE
jgi:hypothetical protein